MFEKEIIEAFENKADDDVKTILVQNPNLMLCGGAPLCALMDMPIRDYDIYPAHPEFNVNEIIEILIDIQNQTYEATFLSHSSFPLGTTIYRNLSQLGGVDKPSIQVITENPWRGWGEHDFLKNRFDFGICQVGIRWSVFGWICFTTTAFNKDYINKTITYKDPDKLTPAAWSFSRLLKYVKRGFEPDWQGVAVLLSRIVREGYREALANEPFLITPEEIKRETIQSIYLELQKYDNRSA